MGGDNSKCELTKEQKEQINAIVNPEALKGFFVPETTKPRLSKISDASLQKLKELLAFPTDLSTITDDKGRFKPLKMCMDDYPAEDRLAVADILGEFGFGMCNWKDPNTDDDSDSDDDSRKKRKKSQKTETPEIKYQGVRYNRDAKIELAAIENPILPTRQQYFNAACILRDGTEEESLARFAAFWNNLQAQMISGGSVHIATKDDDDDDDDKSETTIIKYCFQDNNLRKKCDIDQGRFKALRDRLRENGLDIFRHPGLESIVPEDVSVYVVDNRPPKKEEKPDSPKVEVVEESTESTPDPIPEPESPMDTTTIEQNSVGILDSEPGSEPDTETEKSM